MVSGFSAALALARASSLIATVPERHTAALRTGLQAFELRFVMPEITVSLLWHPRLHADPAHRRTGAPVAARLRPGGVRYALHDVRGRN